ncbi:MAG TPA: NADH-quinone oxidoreductase subunit NuoE [Candidatus Polarisedimenticolia bacterium]|nr:NADH-quinone oxidoreductase subunit NuoE [Candidatus Polarisedimenticolia bacterium]
MSAPKVGIRLAPAGKGLSDETLRRIDEAIARYPVKQSALLPALWLAQQEQGYCSTEAQEQIAARIGVSPAFVAGVVSFYTMYHTAPVGRHVVDVCTTVSCWLRGSDELVRHIEGRLGIKAGQTTPDGRFTLRTVECLGSCGTAPMCQIGDDYHEDLTPETMDRLLETLR